MSIEYQLEMARDIQNDIIVNGLALITGATYDETRRDLKINPVTGQYILPSGYTYDKYGQIVYADLGGADVGHEDSNQFFFG